MHPYMSSIYNSLFDYAPVHVITALNAFESMFQGQKKFQCLFCGILLSTKNYLKNHINAVHTKARVYPCDICER